MKTKNILITIGVIFLVLIVGGGLAAFFAIKSGVDYISKNSSSIASQLSSTVSSLSNSSLSSANSSLSSSNSISNSNSNSNSISSSSVAQILVPADPAGEALIRASIDAIDGSVQSGNYDTFTKYVDLKAVTKSFLNSDPTLDKTTRDIANTYFDDFFAEQESIIREDFAQGDAGLFNASKNQTFTVKKSGSDSDINYVAEVLNPDSVSNTPYRMYFRQNPSTQIWQLYQILDLQGKPVNDIS